MGFAYPGGMAEFVRIPARALAGGHVIRISSGLLPEHAARAKLASSGLGEEG